ncbi:hypothetical protein Lal_00030036 [Lupinus albus]|uniref:Uncharacterized protein n=1 Tax=Lupinus albus TaxID=3870 RepID=A0A6A4PC68_LUPAL|nr:hypothetical protein Lalb_Chr16g0386311 [Lupinus albus]KAF1874607.1 hypothetical protein Lal_00030036 [Lupinus albus]
MANSSSAPPNTTTSNAVINISNATATLPPSSPAVAAKIGGTLTSTFNRTETPSKSARGQNKPKCIQCGNVARSRCPYECCKSCCSRNQNPCHIHVLKASSTLPDKIPSSGAAPLDQQSSEPLQTTAGRVASLRQLSNSFAQFNNLNISVRSKRPLTRKDAAAINEWRFSKLKEYKEQNIELENEAFDRYMQNVELLEEVLSVKSVDDSVSSASECNPTSAENNETTIPGLKLQLRSNSTRSGAARMRIRQIVDGGLETLQKCAVGGGINEPIDEEAYKASKRGKRTEMLSSVSDLIDKINKARIEEDLKSCLEMKFQLFNNAENQTVESDAAPAKETDYSLPKLVMTTEVDQETLNTIDKHFTSLEHVQEL